MVLEGLLDAPCGGGADALVDPECLLHVGGGLAGVAVLQVAVAESFQGACFFGCRAEVAGDGQGMGVVPAGLGGVCGPDRELAEAVECLGLAEPVAEISEQGQGLLVASGGGGVVAGLLQHEAQVVEGLGLPGRQIWVGGPGMLHRLRHSCPPRPPKETYAMPAPLADNAITGTGNQAGAPGIRALAPATPDHGPRKARALLPRADRLRRVARRLRRVPGSGASYHDSLFERPDLVEDDYYRFRYQPCC